MHHALIFSQHLLMNRRSSGPHRIATILREQAWDVEVIDYLDHWGFEQLKELVRSRITSSTVFVGYGSVWAFWHKDTIIQWIVDWIRKEYPHVRQIFGAQIMPQNPEPKFDYYVIGYGENAILELAKSLVGGGNTITFDPRYFGDKKVIDANTHYPAFPDPNLHVKYEDRDFIQPWEWLITSLSRGCKFSCKFCSFPVLGVRGDYTRSAKNAELEFKDNYDRFGITHYYLADETVNDSTEKLTKFGDVIENLPFKIYTSGFIRADLLVSKPEQLEQLCRMQMFSHFYGIESMNNVATKTVGKGMNPNKLFSGLLEIKKYMSQQGLYRGTISTICGLPGETEESWNQLTEWLLANWKQQTTHMHVLEIPINNNFQKSYFTDNWKDLGYRESNNQIDRSLEQFVNLLGGSGAGVHEGQSLVWENDYMDQYKAVEITERAYQRLIDHGDMRVGTFSEGDYANVHGSIEHIHKLPFTQPLPIEGYNKNYQDYITRKLNV
jgi:hypothetical protein